MDPLNYSPQLALASHLLSLPQHKWSLKALKELMLFRLGQKKTQTSPPKGNRFARILCLWFLNTTEVTRSRAGTLGCIPAAVLLISEPSSYFIVES